MSGGAFHDVLFPLRLSVGSTIGPERSTRILSVGGFEKRQGVDGRRKKRPNLILHMRTHDALHELLAFFEARRGRLHAFRWRDPADCTTAPNHRDKPKAEDLTIGFGDGEQTAFALQLPPLPGETQFRPVLLPAAGSILAAVGGARTTAFSLAPRGVLTFAAPPPIGARVTAGCVFDAAMRFDTDRLEIRLDSRTHGSVGPVPLLEVLI